MPAALPVVANLDGIVRRGNSLVERRTGQRCRCRARHAEARHADAGYKHRRRNHSAHCRLPLKRCEWPSIIADFRRIRAEKFAPRHLFMPELPSTDPDHG
jgi:hypothetical protein